MRKTNLRIKIGIMTTILGIGLSMPVQYSVMAAQIKNVDTVQTVQAESEKLSGNFNYSLHGNLVKEGTVTWEYDAENKTYILDGGTSENGYATIHFKQGEAWLLTYPLGESYVLENAEKYVIKNMKIIGDMSNMFDGVQRYVKSISFENVDTQNVTSMHDTFYNCEELTSLNIGGLNTSNVTDMGGMFASCGKLTSLDVSNFNTDNVKDFSSMFASCDKLTSLDVSNFNTKKAENMSRMFVGCSKLTNLDVSNFNTANVEDFSSMFSLCKGLINLDVSNFNTEKAEDMHNMFRGCDNLSSLDLSMFYTSNVKNFSGLFRDDENLCSLNLNGWDFSGAENIAEMCSGLYSLEDFSFVKNMDVSNVKYINDVFTRCKSMKELDLSNWDLSSLTTGNAGDNIGYVSSNDYLRIFSDCTNLEKVYTPRNSKFNIYAPSSDGKTLWLYADNKEQLPFAKNGLFQLLPFDATESYEIVRIEILSDPGNVEIPQEKPSETPEIPKTEVPEVPQESPKIPEIELPKEELKTEEFMAEEVIETGIADAEQNEPTPTESVESVQTGDRSNAFTFAGFMFMAVGVAVLIIVNRFKPKQNINKK